MAEIYVTSTADSGAGSLRQALADAVDGDVILFDSDVFPIGQTTSILLSSYITVNKSVSIYGGASDGAGGYTSGATKEYYVYRDVDDVRTKVVISSPDDAQEGETVLFSNVCRVALDGQGTVRGVSTGQDAAFFIAGITFINGGVTISGNSVGTLDQCYVTNATAQNGAGIFIVSSAVATINDCAIYNCTTTGIGGGTYVRDNNNITTFNNCCFDSCSANSGGAFCSYNTSQSTFNYCVFYGNIALGTGGAFQLNVSARVTLNDCYIVRCKATNGVAYATNNSVFICNRCTFSDCNSTSNGGALYAASNSQCDLTDCFITNCNSGTGGGGIYLNNTSKSVFNNCQIINCSSKNGGGIYLNVSAKSTLNGCTITGCNSQTDGGAVYSYSSSQSTLNDCVFDSCSATNNGGGFISYGTSQNTLNGCIITNCSATNGGAAYSAGDSTNTLINCTLNNNASLTLGRHGFVIGQRSVLTATSCNFDAVYMGASSTLNIDGITLINVITTTTATITIEDGAALSVTDTATIGAATFTSDGRGYLAVLPGIDTSAATLTNVVLCAYGADVSSFAEVDGVLEWEAADPTTTVLIERASGDSWTTVAQPTGESLTLYLPPSDTVRLFDGVHFFTAQAPSQRTYYYIGGANGSFTSSADWSLRRGGVAITEAPVVAGQRFIVGDIAEEEQGS